MRNFFVVFVLSICASLCHAQATKDEAALLTQIRAKYDVPFERNLKSFDCAVDFDWKKHWAETYRVGDEGTDGEIEKFIQPIRNRVTVTHDDAIVSSGMTDEQESKLPHGGMAEGLLKHTVRFSLRTWLVASNNALLPSSGTPVHFEPSASGYILNLKIQHFDVAMVLARDMSLQSMGVKDSDSDRQEFEFHPGPQGFLLASWTMGEDGNFKDGNRLLFNYTYQTVGGFQIPAQVVVNRESHHEMWHYTLSDCKVTTDK
ncbi:MAG: hypothetical protein ABSA39_18670 [Edaphobacter sp.]